MGVAEAGGALTHPARIKKILARQRERDLTPSPFPKRKGGRRLSKKNFGLRRMLV